MSAAKKEKEEEECTDCNYMLHSLLVQEGKIHTVGTTVLVQLRMYEGKAQWGTDEGQDGHVFMYGEEAHMAEHGEVILFTKLGHQSIRYH